MAVAVVNEDRLKTFNEIIYSQIIIQRLIDSLYSDERIETQAQRQNLTALIKRNIAISRQGSDAFYLTYTETDSLRAKRGCELVAAFFMETILKIEGQRNQSTVEFFEKKLAEIKEKFEVTQKEIVSHLKENTSILSEQTRNLYSAQIESLEKQLGDLDARLKTYQTQLVVLRAFPGAIHSDNGKQSLYDLAREDLPFASDLRKLLDKYDEFLRHYTEKYPEVKKIETQILELLERVRNGIAVELAKQQEQRLVLERRRAQLIEDIRQSSISERMDEDKESDYTIYRRLYNDMKVKLEQARTTRDLGGESTHQFIILTPPVVPAQPSKPNRMQLILGGIGLGLFVGFMSMILREMFDTTIRVPRDVEIYQKPVIAFITDGDNGAGN